MSDTDDSIHSNDIKINDNWKVRWDGRQYTLYRFMPAGREFRSIQSGKTELSKDHWASQHEYYRHLESAVRAVIKYEASENASNLKEFIEIQKTLQDELAELLV